MSEEFDGWVNRLLKRLRENRAERVEEIASGALDHDRYRELCGRVSEIDQLIAMIPEFMRGEDLRSAQPARVRSVEE